MKRRFCDFCGKEITNDVVFELGIYDEILEKETYQRDMCEKCKNKVKKLLKEITLSQRSAK